MTKQDSLIIYQLESEALEPKVDFSGETKNYCNEGGIPQVEQSKTYYAKKFFQAFQLQFPDVDIWFETRINKQSLSEILQRCV